MEHKKDMKLSWINLQHKKVHARTFCKVKLYLINTTPTNLIQLLLNALLSHICSSCRPTSLCTTGCHRRRLEGRILSFYSRICNQHYICSFRYFYYTLPKFLGNIIKISNYSVIQTFIDCKDMNETY